MPAGRSCRRAGRRAASASAPEVTVGDAAAGGLDSQRRLARQRDYAAVFRTGQRSADRYFTVIYRPNGLGYGRLGLAITRRRLRGAVCRNRVKRQIRESFRLHQRLLVGLDVVVLAQPGLADVDSATLRGSLRWHWEKLRVHSTASSSQACGVTNAT